VEEPLRDLVVFALDLGEGLLAHRLVQTEIHHRRVAGTPDLRPESPGRAH